ncbi:MAG: ribosome biogenesis factor YjgA [Spongiibacteraceae bacterium]|jgi:ribosome-associated protein|nr:ribosome biogenesis factor YjgA [Spongiibacteraceae bacterium]
MIDESDSYSDDDFDRPSKSAVKREMLALQALGAALVDLPDGQLASMPLEDPLLEAIQTARRIKSREGRRRQLQYIGKLMRKIDVTELQAAYDDLLNGRQLHNQQFHELEALRDQLVEVGPESIGEVVERYPAADRQHLRQLIVAARREREAERPPASARKLFRYLRELAEL